MSSDVFHRTDLDLLRARGVAPESIEWQVRILKSPPPAIELDRPCTRGDGIDVMAAEDLTPLAEEAEQAAQEGRILKFVPASGAATRMFKDLSAALEDETRPPAAGAAKPFFQHLRDFAFYALLSEVLGRAADALVEQERAQRDALRVLLEPSGLGYRNLPKALIPFHRYEDGPRSAFEEQLLEAAGYGRDRAGVCRVHFTVAEEQKKTVESFWDAVRDSLEGAGNTRFEVEFSVQHPSTDTIAIRPDGSLFRLGDGTLLFRPGGHGALLRNLQETGAEIAVVKNIDNVVPSDRMGVVVQWKKVLIGLLVRLQQRCFASIEAAADPATHPSVIDTSLHFAASVFSRTPRDPLRSDEERRRFVIEALNRPLRVCGAVRNEGEPGGAPFWVRERDGRTSIQIVESSQVDFADDVQAQIWNGSTHFNPVDLVCGLRDWKGNRFELSEFVDPEAVFIAGKSHGGEDLLALELPGLWNGGMARWNTVCVEVPPETFAPVKTVFDLLRPEHRTS